jgi:hypothetical protein
MLRHFEDDCGGGGSYIDLDGVVAIWKDWDSHDNF